MHSAQPCDVFICHRGPDTKLNLVSHIWQSFKGRAADLEVFLDSNLPKGSSSWQTIQEKLRGARCVLVILSRNFEPSYFCLEEVTIALERSSFICPIFSDREPGTVDDAALQRTYETARLAQLDVSVNTVSRWRKALKSLEGIAGKAGWVHNSRTECVSRTVWQIIRAASLLACQALFTLT